MSSTYQFFRENCALCGADFPKRDLNKILMAPGHTSVSSPKKLCGLCDDCLPKLLDFLEVPEPEEKERPYTLARLCYKCYNHVGKTARYCPYCGDELATQVPKEVHHEN